MLKVKEKKDSELLSDQFEGISEKTFDEAKDIVDAFQKELDENLRAEAKELVEQMEEGGGIGEGQDITKSFKIMTKYFNTQELQNILLIQLMVRIFKEKTQAFISEIELIKLTKKFED